MQISTLLTRGSLGFSLVLLAACGVGGPGNQYEDSGIDAAPPVDAAPDIDAEVIVPTVTMITVQDFRDRFVFGESLGQKTFDLRSDIAECERAHLFHSICGPIDIIRSGGAWVQNGAFVTTKTFDDDAPLIYYGSASQEAEVEELANASLDLGYTDIYWVTGGIEAWQANGWFMDVSYNALIDPANGFYPPDDLAGVYIFDNMDATAYAGTGPTEGHIPGAYLLDTKLFYDQGQLVDSGNALTSVAPLGTTNVLIFYCVNLACESSLGASLGAEILGYPLILHYAEGLDEWRGNGQPVNTGPNP